MRPLRAVIHGNAPVIDERSTARRTLGLDVPAYASGDSTEALIHNLSETGLLIETSVELQVGESLQVELSHAGITSALVIWSRGQLVGCEFAAPVSSAAISAALLRNPIRPRQPVQAAPISRREAPPYSITPTQPLAVETDPPDEPNAYTEEGPWLRALTIASLLLALAAASIFIIALLSFPLSA